MRSAAVAALCARARYAERAMRQRDVAAKSARMREACAMRVRAFCA